MKSAKPIKITYYLYGLSALAFLIRLCLFVVNAPFIEGDTSLLVNKETSAIRKCLSEGHFSACPGSGDFPLLQNVPSLILSYLGVSGPVILHTLAYLSFLSFVGSVLLIYWTLKKKAAAALAVTGALITITSPLLWYSHSTFGEMAAAFLILAFTSACLMRAPWWVMAAFFVLAGSTKEIAFPFLMAVGLLCLLAESPTRERKTRLATLMAAAGLTIGVTFAFNYFRFGTFFNGSYASKLNIVPTFRLQLSFFMGIWFSPNGGLALFWPSFMLLYLAVLGVALLRIARKKFREQNVASGQKDLRFYAPLLTVSAILFLLTAGFSRWYTPLGGFAWGPRFMLPWIPALTLLLTYFYRDELSGILGLILHQRIGLVLSALVIFVVSVPQFSILFGEFVLAKIFAYPECPHVPVIQEGTAYYYQCLQTQIWPRRIIILELYRVALKAPALWFSILCGAVLVTGLQEVRRQLAKDEISRKASLSIAASLAATAAMLRRAIAAPARHGMFVVAFYSLVFLAFFFPAIYQGSLLAVDGDGLLIYLPNFYSHKVLWDTLLLSGFPMMADPQVMTWYPPAFLLSFLPGSWNVFITVAYVFASSFMYGYLYTLTRSRFAALVSGLIFGLSGFMLAHLGHAVIVHAAAWLPLIIWSLEMLRRRLSVKWLLIGSFAVTLCFLAGQPQIFFYGLTLGGAYVIALGRSAPAGRWRYFSTSFLMVVLGIGLAAIQFIPTTELAGQGLLSTHNFERFIAFSLPPRQALTMIFPLVFGGLPQSGVLPYFGAPYQTELTGYMGVFALVLVAFGVVITRKRALAWFWLCFALLAFLLAMGGATPLARLLFHVPIMKGFRAPARHFMELTIAFSVLSGLGVAAFVRRQVSATLLRRAIVIAGLAMIVCVILLFINSSYLAALAATRPDITRLSLLPWNNRAVGVPLIIFLLAISVLAYWHKQPSSLSRRVLVLIVLVIDLGSFGWFYEWRYAATDKSALIASESANRLRSSLDLTNQRLMPYRGTRGTIAEMPPNLSRLWGVPSANGYNVLISSRMSNLLRMIDYTGVPPPWNEPNDQSLSVTAVRYLVLPHDDLSKDESGSTWFQENMQFWIGASCGESQHNSAKLVLPAPVKSTALAVVSRLACSSQIPDAAEVIRLRLSDTEGHVQVRSLRAGRESSEWAYDCGSVRPGMRHQRAQIFSSYPAKMNDQPCDGHIYVARLALDGNKEIKSIDFDWVGGSGAIILEKLTLLNDQTGTPYPIDSALFDTGGWQLIEDAQGIRVYENLHAMPRAWLAGEVVKVTANEALDVVKRGALPDGRSFDPKRTALVEQSLALPEQNDDRGVSATVTALTNTRMDVRTSSATPRFLVTSDAYYPGWQASVDGKDTELYRADYAIRGVMVPAGEHTVRFDYRPRSFYLGVAVSLVSILLLGALAVGARWLDPGTARRTASGGTR